MPNKRVSVVDGTRERRLQYARWSRLLDTILPPADADRLVPVAEVRRDVVGHVEESLAEAGLRAVLSPTRSFHGDERFKVLVPAREAEIAGQVVAGF